MGIICWGVMGPSSSSQYSHSEGPAKPSNIRTRCWAATQTRALWDSVTTKQKAGNLEAPTIPASNCPNFPILPSAGLGFLFCRHSDTKGSPQSMATTAFRVGCHRDQENHGKKPCRVLQRLAYGLPRVHQNVSIRHFGFIKYMLSYSQIDLF